MLAMNTALYSLLLVLSMNGSLYSLVLFSQFPIVRKEVANELKQKFSIKLGGGMWGGGG